MQVAQPVQPVHTQGEYSALSVDDLGARCTACAWVGPLWRAECRRHTPPHVVLGCPRCASALVVAR